MKTSEKFLSKKSSETIKVKEGLNNYTLPIAFSHATVTTYGDICHLEGTIDALVSRAVLVTDPKHKSIMTTAVNIFREDLKKIEKEENL